MASTTYKAQLPDTIAYNPKSEVLSNEDRIPTTKRLPSAIQPAETKGKADRIDCIMRVI